MGTTKLMKRYILLFFIGGVVGFVVFKFTSSTEPTLKPKELMSSTAKCSIGDQSKKAEDTPNIKDLALMRLDDKYYTKELLPKNIQRTLYKIENERFQQVSGYLQEFAVRLALSKMNGQTENVPALDQLLPKVDITDAQMGKFFNENKGKFPPNVTFAMMKAQIKDYLHNRNFASMFSNEVKILESSKRLEILVDRPIAPMITLAIDKFPSLGNSDSKNTLIEVSDYMCGHCQGVHAEVRKVVEMMKNKLKFVQINFSLNPGGQSGTLIRGAYCANAQGADKFWKYHNLTFEAMAHEEHDHSKHDHSKHDHSKHGEEDRAKNLQKAIKLAKNSGLDVKKFKLCINSDESMGHIRETNNMLSKAGISSTPTFFLNNRKLEVGHKGLMSALIENLIK
ncbi:MAG: thioredoxin domain-containing protein [Bacteriovoracaceae bacterium]|nr:thioredoxin domain-containing protein [Bacteriovoracaceae bacterium]